jgi:phosphatidylglycerol:prolipoprotein diacylglycerol transferase
MTSEAGDHVRLHGFFTCVRDLSDMTIGLSPTIEIGPLSLAWHGILSPLGLAAGLLLAVYLARRDGVDPNPLVSAALGAVVAGLVGARLFYLVQTDASRLLTPWSGGLEGFAFYGAILLGLPAAALVLRRGGHPVLPYLDLVAAAFPLGMAIGRVGDLLNGEHYGSETDLPWGVTYTSPETHVPEVGVAYESGALYEVGFALALAAFVLLVRRSVPRPGQLLWLVLGLYSLGRFLIFFVIRDVPVVALGLRQAQWTSLALIAVSLAGGLWSLRRPAAPGARRPWSRIAGA